MNTIINYFKGVWSELVKVTWPTREQVVNHTVIVLVSAAIAVMITAGIDFGLTRLVELIVSGRS